MQYRKSTRVSLKSHSEFNEKWLQQPDVGLALDPEWAMKPGQVPMRVFGHTTGREINEVTAWVGSLEARHQLPEKVVVVHEPRSERGRQRASDGVADLRL